MESLPLPAKVGTAGEGGDGYDGYRLMVDTWVTWGTEILPGMDWIEDEKRFSVCDRTFFISWTIHGFAVTNILNCRSLNQSALAPGAWSLFSEWWGQWGLWKWDKLGMAHYGGFLKWWYPTTMGFPTKNYHFGVFWGVPPFKETPLWPQRILWWKRMSWRFSLQIFFSQRIKTPFHNVCMIIQYS